MKEIELTDIFTEFPDSQQGYETQATFPDSVETPNGELITFYSKDKIFPTTIRYGSAASACLINVPSAESNPALDKIMAQGWIEESDGSFNQEFAVPVELFTLPSGEACAVLTTNLNNTSAGFTIIHDQANVDAQNMFATLAKLAKAVKCLADNGLFLSSWDGHQFYFNAKFGTVTIVPDGTSISSDPELNADGAVDKALAAAMLYCLTGAFPITKEGDPYATLFTTNTHATLRYNDNTQAVESNCCDVKPYWDALPKKLRDTFEECFFTPDATVLSPDAWLQLFTQLSETTDSEECLNCGGYVISDALICPHCGKNLDKRQLMIRWLIEDTSRSCRFGIALPINMALSCAMVSPNLPKGNILRIGYNATNNMLAIQNISNDTLSVDYGEFDSVDIAAQKLFVLKKGMRITSPSMKNISITLLKLDSAESWEVNNNV